MKKERYELNMAAAKLINIFLMAAPFAICWFLCYADFIVNPFYAKGNWVVIAIFVILYTMLCNVYDGFLVELTRIPDMLYSQILALTATNALMYCIVLLLMRRLPNVLPFVALMVVQIILSNFWCRGAHRWYFSVHPPKKTAVIYSERKDMERLIGSYGLDKRFEVVITAAVEDCIEDLEMLSAVEHVFINDVHSQERNIILKYCIANDIDVYVIPRIGDVIMSGAKKMHLFHLPVLNVGRYNPGLLYLFVKRCMDIVLSLVALVVLSPVYVVVAIAIKTHDGGPVFYKQERLTKNGKKFMIHKFRSMRIDAEKDGVAMLSSGDNDPRITPVGRVIRKLRIDELPQLLDILKGDMSIVGPRAEREEISLIYEEELPEFRLRLQAKAGLTGYAQVYGKYNTKPYDKLKMDLMYLANPSILEDLRICLATVKILFKPESTEGFAEEDIEELVGSAR